MTSRHDEQQQDPHILYGGPEPELIDSTSRSLGEVILKKLAENGTDPMFVSILLGFHLRRVIISRLIFVVYVSSGVSQSLTRRLNKSEDVETF